MDTEDLDGAADTAPPFEPPVREAFGRAHRANVFVVEPCLLLRNRVVSFYATERVPRWIVDQMNVK